MADNRSTFHDLQCYTMHVESENSTFSQHLMWFIERMQVAPDAVNPELPVAQISCVMKDSLEPMAGFEGVTEKDIRYEVYGEMKVLEHPDRTRIFRPGQFLITFVKENSNAEITLTEAATNSEITLCAILAFDHSSRAGAACLVHSACLDTKAGNRFLIAAESGVGKTTTCLKLARSGMALSGDDTTLVWEQDGKCVGFGIPRPARVSKDALSRVDGLEDIIKHEEWGDGDEQELSHDQLRGFVTLAERKARPIQAVVRLTRSETGPARISELAPAHAMALNLAENITAGPDGLTNHQMERFELYTQLFGTSTCLQLELGNDDADFIAATEAAIDQ